MEQVDVGVKSIGAVRQLASNGVMRATVAEAQVEQVGERFLVLKTQAPLTSKRDISSADSEMLYLKAASEAGEPIAGTYQIDVLDDAVIRFRYAPAEQVPANETPMVCGSFDGAKTCRIFEAGKTKTSSTAAAWEAADGGASGESAVWVIETAAVRMRIKLKPFQIVVDDVAGNQLTGIGGPEKDYFCNWDSFNTGVNRVIDTGAPVATESFDLAPGEAIYGLGEKFIKLNKVGQTIDLDMVDALGVITPRSYKNIPFFVSNKGYGVYFNHSSLMTYWVGSMAATDIQVGVVDDFLDYTLFAGSIKEVLPLYAKLTGQPAVPPEWTFGFWQSKISYKSAEETLEVARSMREHEIPCDVIHLDTHWFKADWYCDLEFDKERFPDPAAYLKELADMGFKVSLWQLPYIPEGSALFDALKAVDGFVKTKDGDIYNCGLCFTPGFKGVVAIVDYTNPEAVKVHQAAFRRLFEMGAKVVKTDFGEMAPLDGVYHDGTPGHQMHNLYPLLYNKAVAAVTGDVTGDAVVWARSAWAGSQRYPIHWGGDNSPNFENFIPQLEGGLSFGMSGCPFWSEDIGGFIGQTYDRLLIRWMQFSMFLSHSRIHGYGDREVYKFEPETARICRDFINLRYQLMPYLYGTALACGKTALPFARPLVVEYQDDPAVWSMGDEFLCGDSLLVAPVYNDSGRRDVYLPEGVWTDWWTHARIEGRRVISTESSLEQIPIYIREGAIIPMGPVMQYTGEKSIQMLTVMVSALRDEGARCFAVPVNGSIIELVYCYDDGVHRLEHNAENVQVDLQWLGTDQGQVVKKG